MILYVKIKPELINGGGFLDGKEKECEEGKK